MIQFFSTIASKASLAIAFCTFALVLSIGASAHGDEYSRIDSMAKKVQKKSELLTKETTHYRHTAQYASLIDATTHLVVDDVLVVVASYVETIGAAWPFAARRRSISSF